MLYIFHCSFGKHKNQLYPAKPFQDKCNDNECCVNSLDVLPTHHCVGAIVGYRSRYVSVRNVRVGESTFLRYF